MSASKALALREPPEGGAEIASFPLDGGRPGWGHPSPGTQDSPSPLAGEGWDGGMSTKTARQLRNNLTDAERRLWQKLKRRQIATLKFRRQQPIGAFIVDFVCFERRVIVEVDGGQHAEQVPYDEQRMRWLEAEGYLVLRFWNNDVLANTEAVAQAILDAVEQRM